MVILLVDFKLIPTQGLALWTRCRAHAYSVVGISLQIQKLVSWDKVKLNSEQIGTLCHIKLLNLLTINSRHTHFTIRI